VTAVPLYQRERGRRGDGGGERQIVGRTRSITLRPARQHEGGLAHARIETHATRGELELQVGGMDLRRARTAYRRRPAKGPAVVTAPVASSTRWTRPGPAGREHAQYLRRGESAQEHPGHRRAGSRPPSPRRGLDTRPADTRYMAGRRESRGWRPVLVNEATTNGRPSAAARTRAWWRRTGRRPRPQGRISGRRRAAPRGSPGTARQRGVAPDQHQATHARAAEERCRSLRCRAAAGERDAAAIALLAATPDLGQQNLAL